MIIVKEYGKPFKNMDNSDGSHSDGGEPVVKRVRGSTKMGDLVARHEKQRRSYMWILMLIRIQLVIRKTSSLAMLAI
ncbi:hypothetical protein K1719_045832 [Acacia pycnantha]|nr:hypothetical protein K1719_045832 [Acacia pycnantha]